MKKLLIILTLIGLGAFLWWTISPLFIDKEVNDELPEISVSDATITETSQTDEISKIEADQSGAEIDPTNVNPNEILYPIKDTPGHPASGNIRVVRADGEQIIRFEDYDGTNGPDLKIYLAKDLKAKEYIDLGPARGNKGNINYGVPLDVNIDEYQYVLTWCEAFGVLFDYAEIN